MKQLKDYAHLYLGCDVYISHPNAAFTKDILDTDLLTRLYNDLPIKNYKLILRPLSNITEEEKRSVWSAQPDKFPDHPYGFYTVMEFEFLLSKHFDLFGLIESGLAIDSTNLKTAKQ